MFKKKKKKFNHCFNKNLHGHQRRRRKKCRVERSGTEIDSDEKERVTKPKTIVLNEAVDRTGYNLFIK